MKSQTILDYVTQVWDNSITPTLCDYIKIPNKSPAYDPDWEKQGFMNKAVDLIANWCREHAPKNMQLEVLTAPGKTPLIFMEIPGEIDDTVLLYGHLDKQPEMEGWDEDKGPWKPVIVGEKLYGRGGADDGYSAFASLTAINALQQQNIPHARCVVIIEACEESGSFDLPYYIDRLQDRIGKPSLIICLDSGSGNYEQMWSTTSLRGVISGTLTVEVLSQGVHSGLASGIVPSSFRIVRELLNRVENSTTGEILVDELKVEIPKERQQQASYAAEVLKDKVYSDFPFLENTTPINNDLTELVLNNTWRPTLSVTGAAGFPDVTKAGNVLRPKSSFKLSFRIPPTVESKHANLALKKIFESNPPYGAKVTYHIEEDGAGWDAPKLSDWLKVACDQASESFFGKPTVYLGIGASIPFMGMLGEKYPAAQFLITGVLGPQSNAHGPNEFLHLTYAKKITACVAEVIAKHYDKFAK